MPRPCSNCGRHSPGLRVIYWWGDILSDAALARIRTAAGCADRILVSYAGSHARLEKMYGDRVVYFPFGVAPAFHCVDCPDRAGSSSHFGADVAFVGTCYPERCELLRYLNSRLDRRSRSGDAAGATAAACGGAAHCHCAKARWCMPAQKSPSTCTMPAPTTAAT